MNKFKNKYIIFILLFILLFIGAYVVLSGGNKEVKISNTEPVDQANDVLPSSSIVIEFSNDLNEDKQNQISFVITPNIATYQSWTENNTLKITPKEFLINNTTYTVEVSYQDNILSEFTFIIKADDATLTEEEATELLNKGERLYSRSISEDLDNNPWKANFPIITDDYTVIYAPPKDAYSVDFLKSFSPSEQDSLMIKIKAKLKEIGAPEKQIYIFEG